MLQQKVHQMVFLALRYQIFWSENLKVSTFCGKVIIFQKTMDPLIFRVLSAVLIRLVSGLLSNAQARCFR